MASQNGIVKNVKIKSLRSLIIFDLLNSLDNSKLDNQKKSLSILLNSILEKKTVIWIENFPLKYLKESAPLINHFSLLLEKYPAVAREIKYQPIFSNTMLLTPTEWISNFSN